jgi:hypothetical protein
MNCLRFCTFFFNSNHLNNKLDQFIMKSVPIENGGGGGETGAEWWRSQCCEGCDIPTIPLYWCWLYFVLPVCVVSITITLAEKRLGRRLGDQLVTGSI